MKKLFFRYLHPIWIILLVSPLVNGDQMIRFGDVGISQLKNVPYDYASFTSNTKGKVRLEVYTQIYNYFLTFEGINNLYKADYELIIDVLGDNDAVVVSDKKNKDIKVESIARTHSLTEFRSFQSSFDLDPGKYKISVTLRDKKTRKVYIDDFKVKLSKFQDKSPKLSDIEFVQAISSVENLSGSFVKGNINVIPSVSRIYGGYENDNKILFYVEVYPGEKNGFTETLMITRLRNRTFGKMVYRDSVTVPLDNVKSMQLRNIAIDDLSPGLYDLEIELRGNRNKKLDEKQTSFNIRMTPEMFIKHDYRTVLNQLSLIAEKDEIKEMKEIEDLTARIEAFRKFWEKRDPTPGTAFNEMKAEFYRRVQYASSRFSYLRNNGWNTDRGRIYIMYGEPDKLDDYPISPNRRPYQEWHYYRDGIYRKFVFVDENEDGDYRLIYPYDGLNMRPDF